MSPDRRRRVALVTGANRGIGKEIARQLAKAGLHVVLAARDPAKAAAAAQDIGGHDTVVTIGLDVTAPRSIADAVSGIERDWGGIDVLVNNAAIMIDGPGGFAASLFDLTDETMRKTWETNVIGAVRLMRAVLPRMRAEGYGRIVNMSSLAGQLEHMGAGFPAYRMTKAALNAATRIAAAEIGAGNVKINAASPGWVKTDMGGADATRSVAEGAATPVWLALLPQDGPTGGFFHDKKLVAW
jgi:NAD(P)-dependent dehydrogenase (short-subunit alcohol dehydrogenase family)